MQKHPHHLPLHQPLPPLHLLHQKISQGPEILTGIGHNMTHRDIQNLSPKNFISLFFIFKRDFQTGLLLIVFPSSYRVTQEQIMAKILFFPNNFRKKKGGKQAAKVYKLTFSYHFVCGFDKSIKLRITSSGLTVVRSPILTLKYREYKVN